MIILEIVLTVVVWRKGWGARALLPRVALIGAMFLLGIAFGLGGGQAVDLRPIGFLGDVAAVIALAVMAARPPRLAVQPSRVTNVQLTEIVSRSSVTA